MITENILEFKQAFIGYRSRIILRDITFSLPKGSFCLIRGGNGSGKTTLGKAILGIMACLSGKIHTSFRQPGYVPQRVLFDLQYPLTLYDLVAMGKKNRLFAMGGSDEKHVMESLATVGLTKKKDLLLREASGGELQRALVARAFLSSPDMVVLDEPFSNLDSSGLRDMVVLLKEKNQNGSLTICLIDHHSTDLDSWYTHILKVGSQKVTLKKK